LAFSWQGKKVDESSSADVQGILFEKPNVEMKSQKNEMNPLLKGIKNDQRSSVQGKQRLWVHDLGDILGSSICE
jgi:hypothetical protein